jgi:tetratricopeptide (TPR) repeat protein
MTKNQFLLYLVFLPFILIAQSGTKKPTLEDYLRLAEQNKDAGDIKEATRFLNEAATIVWEEKKYDEAVGYFNQSIELNKQINNESGISKIQSNLGMIYADKQQYQASLDWFKKSLVYRETSGTKPEIISCRINIAVVLNNLKQYQEAAQNLETALELATEMNDAQQMKACYGMLAETYEKAGNQERTTHYFNLYRTFTDMIAHTVVKAARQETEQAQLIALQSELAKKEKELELLKTTKELQQTEQQLSDVSAEAKSLIDNNTKQELAISLLQRESELNDFKIQQVEDANNRQKLIIAIIVIALVAALLLAIILYTSFRNKKKLIAQLAEQSQKIQALSGNR